jgi:predicted helicase
LGKRNGRPRYILDLLLSVIIEVSVQAVAIVEKLPKLTWPEQKEE